MIYTCVDSRIITSRITQANPGDYFIIRNPGINFKKIIEFLLNYLYSFKGNLIPNYKELDHSVPRAEEAGLELACNHHNVKSLAVCGHSDCKVSKSCQ